MAVELRRALGHPRRNENCGGAGEASVAPQLTGQRHAKQECAARCNETSVCSTRRGAGGGAGGWAKFWGCEEASVGGKPQTTRAR